MNGLTCWDPVNGAASSACNASQWQCKTVIATGVGTCTGAGNTDSTTFYCGSGTNCNNPSLNTCWDPVNNLQLAQTCSPSQWQCKVNYKNII